jgi:predicted dithiol-disulfide oxidoreductase (DUF899 family)
MKMSPNHRTRIEKKINQAENDLMKRKANLAKLRRKLPLKEVEDFVLKGPKGKPVRLSSLFGAKNELIMVHNMGKGCSYCALWADGFNGTLKHLEDRAAFVVESPDSPEVQAKIKAKRKWQFRFLSSQGTSFRRQVGFESKSGDPWPGVSTFLRDKKGRIFQASSAGFGPGDNYCNVWDLLDLLPTGQAGWGPKFTYR